MYPSKWWNIKGGAVGEDNIHSSFLVKLVKMSAVELVRGCYYTNWAIYRNEPYKFTPEKVPLDLCTHVFYAFAALSTATFEAQPFDSWADIDLKQYEKIANLKKQKPGIKSILSFGGWTMSESGVFEKMAATAAGRAKFAKSAYALANKYGFDGVDLDWEYPNAANKANFAALLKELRAASGGKLLTIAVAAGTEKIRAGYNGAAVAQYVDYVNLMSYDYHGTWESTVGHQAAYSEMLNTVSVWAGLGVPKRKLLLGIGAYGRGWATASCQAGASGPAAPANPVSKQAGYASYFELMSMGGRVIQSPEGPYLAATVNGQAVCYSYDDPAAVLKKMAFVKKDGLGGAFTWTVDFDNASFDIHQAIKKGLTSTGGGDNGTKPKPGGDNGTKPKPGGDNGTKPKPGGDNNNNGGKCTGSLRANVDPKFYDECINGTWVKRPCPPGTVYDPATGGFKLP